jgi:hypothetical protein
MKCDVEVSKSMTIPTGNYGSIKPIVTIVMKDVESDMVFSTYKKIAEVTEAMIALEIISMGDEMQSATEMGFKKYVSALAKNKKDMLMIINDFNNKVWE